MSRMFDNDEVLDFIALNKKKQIERLCRTMQVESEKPAAEIDCLLIDECVQCLAVIENESIKERAAGEIFSIIGGLESRHTDEDVSTPMPTPTRSMRLPIKKILFIAAILYIIYIACAISGISWGGDRAGRSKSFLEIIFFLKNGETVETEDSNAITRYNTRRYDTLPQAVEAENLQGLKNFGYLPNGIEYKAVTVITRKDADGREYDEVACAFNNIDCFMRATTVNLNEFENTDGFTVVMLSSGLDVTVLDLEDIAEGKCQIFWSLDGWFYTLVSESRDEGLKIIEEMK